MTEDESKKAIFELNKEYMSHSKEERLELYDEYIKKRGIIREELLKFVRNQKNDFKEK